MNSFFRDVIAKLITSAEFQGHTSFKVADNKAVGDNPVRELHLDAVSVNNDKSIVSLAWDGGNKLFEKTLPSQEAQHTFDLISSDMSEAVSLTSNGKYDEAKNIMESLVNKYSETSGEVVPTNLPPVTTTQASLGKKAETWLVKYEDHLGNRKHDEIFRNVTLEEARERANQTSTHYTIKQVRDGFESFQDSQIWKQAKITMQNLFFSSADELMEFQKKMKELQPKTDQDSVPLWDMNKSKAPEGEESTDLAPPSLSYDQIEKEKAKETKNLDKRIKEQVKTELESSLEQKKATMFGEKDEKLIEGMRAVGRTWDEIKKYMVKELSYDKESVDMYIDDLRSKEEGTPVEKPMPEAPKPPEHLVSPETHNDLLKDLDTEKKSEPPVKEPSLSPKDIMDIPEEKESSKKCPKCGEDVWDVSTVDQHLNKCWNCGTRFDNPEKESAQKDATCPLCFKSFPSKELAKSHMDDYHRMALAPEINKMESSQEIARADNAEIRKVASTPKDKCKCGHVRYNHALGAKEAEHYGHVDECLNKGCECKKFRKEASLDKQALNPLQEPPVVEQPTAETSNQDIVPMSQTSDHENIQKGDRVFVMSDLGEEKAGFEGTYVSDYTSKGNKYAIIETDEKDLLDVEMHRVSKVSEGTSPEPMTTPELQKLEEPEIAVTPSLEKLTSALKNKKAFDFSMNQDLKIGDKVLVRDREGIVTKLNRVHDVYRDEEEYNAYQEMYGNTGHSWEGNEIITADVDLDGVIVELFAYEIEKLPAVEASLESIKAEVKKLEAQLKQAESEKCNCGHSYGLHGYHEGDNNRCYNSDCKCKGYKEVNKISFKFIKKGLEKHADDSAFEGNGWCRVWVQDIEIESDKKYPEILKLPDENARIAALKELARELAHENLRLADSAGAKVGVQAWFESLTPSDHDRIDWIALANPEPEEVESSLKQSKVMDTKCEDCGKPLGPEVFLSKWPVCGDCTRKKHKKLTQHGTEKKVEAINSDDAYVVQFDYFGKEPNKFAVGGEDYHMEESDVSIELPGWRIPELIKQIEQDPETGDNIVIVSRDHPDMYVEGWDMVRQLQFSKEASLKVKADSVQYPETPKTEYKELKRAPNYMEKAKDVAVPASPDMEQVLVKMESLKSKLSVLDQAKEKIKMAMDAELKKIDVGGERSAIEKELQDSYDKLGILIDATESKVIQWSDQLYTMQHEETQIVPKPSTKELLQKIYDKFAGSESYVESVLNGFKALAKKVQTQTLVKWPKRSSLESVQKEASVMDDLNLLNEEMLKALQALS